MTNRASDKDITALVVVDPYNDFLSEGGKIWPRIKAVAEANNCVRNMQKILNAARQAKLRVFYAMHHRYRPGDYETMKYVAPIQRGRSRIGNSRSSFSDRARRLSHSHSADSSPAIPPSGASGSSLQISGCSRRTHMSDGAE
jgi:nicotinamidase-related amidase